MHVIFGHYLFTRIIDPCIDHFNSRKCSTCPLFTNKISMEPVKCVDHYKDIIWTIS
jgi:hypothetical protein